MGIEINSARFLLLARRLGANCGDALMILQQDLNVYSAKMQRGPTRAGLKSEMFAPSALDMGFAEPFFSAFGARQVHSLDASAFEGADFVHDLNCPVEENLKQRFDLVFDGGTLEHVFNLPTAQKNCMEMLCENGCFISH